MKVETKEIVVIPEYKPFVFSVTIESKEEATWFHDHILCKLDNPDKVLDQRYSKERSSLIGSFFSQSQKAQGRPSAW